jgi:hypothetical protein
MWYLRKPPLQIASMDGSKGMILLLLSVVQWDGKKGVRAEFLDSNSREHTNLDL